MTFTTSTNRTKANDLNEIWGPNGATPTPPTPPVIVKDGGGYVKRGRLVTYIRPADLKPEIARNRIVKKVAKRLKIKRVNAADLVQWAEQSLSSGPEFSWNQQLANSSKNDDLEKAQIAQIKAYWAALEQMALEIAEEDEEILLWLA